MQHSSDSNPAWSESARAAIEATLRARQSRRVATFDFDNTCISGDTGELLHLHLSENLAWNFEGLLQVVDPLDGRDRLAKLVAAHERGEDVADPLRAELTMLFPRRMERCGPAQTYDWAVTLHAGMRVADVHAHADRMLRHEAQVARAHQPPRWLPELPIQRGVRSRPAIAALMRELEAAGIEVWIVSATNEWTVTRAARDFGIPKERVIGNRCVVERGEILAERDGPTTWRQGKVDAIRERIGVDPLLALGDSMTDFEMLEAAQERIVISTPQSVLAEHAASEGWGLCNAGDFDDRPWGTLQGDLRAVQPS